MNFAHLGPAIPPTGHDMAPFQVLAWAANAELDEQGDAVISVRGRQAGQHQLLRLYIRPASGAVTRASTFRFATLMEAPLYPSEVPGNVTDLARTIALEHFTRAAT